jgi:hypothetical protein
MPTISEIVATVGYPKLYSIAGTQEEQHLIELWRWGISGLVYSRLAMDNRKFGVDLIKADVTDIWDKTTTYVEEEKNGDAEIIEIFPFILSKCLSYMQGFEDDPMMRMELGEEELQLFSWWLQRAPYYALWTRFRDRSPSSDSQKRILTWIEGKMVRDYGQTALGEDMRYRTYVTVLASDMIVKGQLKINQESHDRDTDEGPDSEGSGADPS